MGRLELPRPVVLPTLTLVVVLGALWLFAVWDTRPYSPEEIAADRALVAATEDRVPDFCLDTMCVDRERVPSTYLERTPLDLSPQPWDVSAVAVLMMAATGMLIGALWRPGHGARQLLRRTALVAGGMGLIAAELGVFWWLGLAWVAERRGLNVDHFSLVPVGFVLASALLVAMAAMVGATARVLLSGALRTVLTLSVVTTAAGVALLMGPPVGPRLPPMNIEAFLFGAVFYAGPPDAEVCSPVDLPPWAPGDEPREYCTRTVARTAGAAAMYLGGGAGLLVLGAMTANARPRRRASTGST